MLAGSSFNGMCYLDHLGGGSGVQGVTMVKKISMVFIFALMGMVVYLPKNVWAVPSSTKQEVFAHVFLTTLFSLAYFLSNKQKET
jgi:hypothetical protein